MELDELKQQLKNKLATDHTGRSDGDIAALLTKRTVSIIGKLKRSLLIEIILGIFVVLLFSWVGLFSDLHSLRLYFSVFGVVCALFLVLLVYLFRRISQLGDTALPVKSNLQAIVSILQEFSRRYFQFSMLLIPVCIIFSSLLAYHDKPSLQGGKFGHGWFSEAWQVIVVLVLYMVVFSVAMYYFNKWYLRKLYGKYLDQLKDCIKELSEE